MPVPVEVQVRLRYHDQNLTLFSMYHIEVHERIKAPFTVCKYLHLF